MVQFNRFGLLEPGIHPMTLDQVGELFGAFQSSDRRMKLLGKLRTFVEDVQHVDKRIQIVVDGSFVMACVDEPNDIDILLIFPADWDSSAELRPFEYNVVSKRMVRRLYGFDILTAVEGQEAEAEAIAFFAQLSERWLLEFRIPAETTKGLVRVAL